jgi:SAM-dependent methyltransferase
MHVFDENLYNGIKSTRKIIDFMQSKLFSSKYQKEVNRFIENKKKIDNKNEQNKNLSLNKLCNIEDWENSTINQLIPQFHKTDSRIFVHRKDWEFSMGIIAMERFGKLNNSSIALGIGSGKEPVLFYLTNKLKHVYATDIYSGNSWEKTAPVEFLENPQKFSPFSYNEKALTVQKMDGTKLDFPDDKFDIVFSFSSIEHFGGKNHLGAFKSLKETERVLKKGGIAVIATEYIINDREHDEFFNYRTLHSDLIGKLDKLRLVEPLDLNISTRTLDTVLEYYSDALRWKSQSDEYKLDHPHIIIRSKNIIWTSIMLVFEKR